MPFITSDGPWSESIFRSGTVENALPTGNFGSSAEWQFGQMKKIIGDNKPLMCMEFWNGWFDAWGDEHHVTDPKKAAQELEELLKRGSLNFYMFEGGTNFGFMNGRNGGSKAGDVTSYDYDAPLTEDGQITEKYKLFKGVISRFRGFSEIPLTAKIKRKEYGAVYCSGKADLFSVLEKISQPVKSKFPLTMEEIGQNYGYILYHADTADTVSEIRLEGAADSVCGYLNGKFIFAAENETLWEKFDITERGSGGTLCFLCENTGRENFGTGLENQRKGISAGIKLNDHRHFGFEIFPLPLEKNQLEKIDFNASSQCNVPAFYKFDFTVDEPCDTFLDTDGFGRGCAFINGFNLGRFRETGPQKRLYLPAPLLKKGKNTIILFETDGKAADSIYLAGEPRLQ